MEEIPSIRDHPTDVNDKDHYQTTLTKLFEEKFQFGETKFLSELQF